MTRNLQTERLKSFAQDNSWVWACAGSLFLWAMIGVVTGRLSWGSLVANGVAASYLTIAALGQMFVISNGRGSIDLSIPGVITLSAFLATGIINGIDSNLVLGVSVAISVGALVGCFNGLFVLVLKIPAIIATLAMGYILITATLVYNEGFRTFRISPTLIYTARGRILGIPVIIYLVILMSIVAALILNRTTYGRMLTAVGQNLDAARLSGVRTGLVQMTAYITSGVFAAIAGVLISGRIGGAFLQMGDPYLLETVGAVVIGGTLIFGGRSTVVGTYFGALFFVLIVTTMQIAGFPVGTQNIVKGILIILVLMIATDSPTRQA